MILDPLPPATVRTRILDHLLERFRGARTGQNGRFITWNTVSDTALTRGEKSVGGAVGIYDVRERKQKEVSYARCAINLVTEFQVRLGHGDRPNAVANLVMGEVQSVMLEDIYCGGLTLSITETGNELEVAGPSDTLVSGVIFWDVLYRHKAGDPRKLVGE